MKRFLVMNVSQSYLGTLKTHDDYVVAAAKAAGSLYQFPEYSDMNRQDLFIAALRELVNKAQRRPFNNHNWVGAFNHSISARLLYPELCQ